MKRIVTIQDISCVGKCSLTVALPIISCMGIETSIIPTAVLSTHTAFNDFTYRDLTDDICKIQDHWIKEKFKFDAIYTGYLGSKNQIEILRTFFKKFKTNKNFIFIDPVMGDNGKLYKGFDEKFVKQMKCLCKEADIIVPNLTEATSMLGMEYKEKYDEQYIKDILFKLSNIGPKYVILTGIGFKENELGIFGYCKEKKEFFKYFKEKIAIKYHGTGDIFASTFVGAIANNNTIEESAKIAVDFVWKCIKNTYIKNKKDAYGVDFEDVLSELIR